MIAVLEMSGKMAKTFAGGNWRLLAFSGGILSFDVGHDGLRGDAMFPAFDQHA
jgi:hypothetical protein